MIVQPAKLRRGKGNGRPEDGLCLMQMVDWFAGNEKVGDTPQCACPILTTVGIRLNDLAPSQAARDSLWPLVWRLLGSRDQKAEQIRLEYIVGEVAHRIVAPLFDAKSPKHALALRTAHSMQQIEAAASAAAAAAASAASEAGRAAQAAQAVEAEAAAAAAAAQAAQAVEAEAAAQAVEAEAAAAAAAAQAAQAVEAEAAAAAVEAAAAAAVAAVAGRWAAAVAAAAASAAVAAQAARWAAREVAAAAAVAEAARWAAREVEAAWEVAEAAAVAAQAAEGKEAVWQTLRDIFEEAINLGPHGEEDPVYEPRAEELRVRLAVTA